MHWNGYKRTTLASKVQQERQIDDTYVESGTWYISAFSVLSSGAEQN
jgi:hypothetical protein